jgi:hypothetical protein
MLVKVRALVPRPRVNLTRFHGAFVRGGYPPNSAWRTVVTPAGRGRQLGMGQPEEADSTPAERRAAMTGFCSCKTGIHTIHGYNLGSGAW